MALTESDIKIIIAAELKKAGFDAAKKATTNLEKSFKKLGSTAAKTFIAVAGVRALKQSVIAFAQEDKAVRGLTNSLRNLGLGYNTSAIENFIEQTEKATGVSKDQLRPAMVQLVTTTLDAQKSMDLLSTAMDISAATGSSLGSVTTALSRAYNGNYSSLGKLQTAYTTAELEAMGFQKSIESINALYTGAAATAADSYQGKIDKLSIAVNTAKQEIGKGLVDAIALLSNGNYDSGLQSLVDFGEKIGDVFQRAAISIRYAKELLSTGFTIDQAERARLDELATLLRNPDAFANRGKNTPASNRQFLADYKKQQALQKKIEADRKKATALAAKTEKERLKREKEAQQLKRAGTVFDMENIQIVAALQGRIDGEQRLRLVALLAINNEIADVAEQTTKAILALNGQSFAALGATIKVGDSATDVINKLLVAQTKVALLQLGIKDLPKANNPFADWDAIIAKILADLGKIQKGLQFTMSVNGQGATGGTTGGTTGGSTGGATGGASGGSNNGDGVVIPNPFNPTGTPVTVGQVSDAINTLTSLRSATETGTPISFLLKEHIDTLQNATTLSAMSALADEQARMSAMRILARPGITADSLFDPSRFRRADEGGAPITVIVQGSVTAAEDLAEIITDIQYEYQRSGKNINFSSLAI